MSSSIVASQLHTERNQHWKAIHASKGGSDAIPKETRPEPQISLLENCQNWHLLKTIHKDSLYLILREPHLSVSNHSHLSIHICQWFSELSFCPDNSLGSTFLWSVKYLLFCAPVFHVHIYTTWLWQCSYGGQECVRVGTWRSEVDLKVSSTLLLRWVFHPAGVPQPASLTGYHALGIHPPVSAGIIGMCYYISHPTPITWVLGIQTWVFMVA